MTFLPSVIHSQDQGSRAHLLDTFKATFESLIPQVGAVVLAMEMGGGMEGGAGESQPLSDSPGTLLAELTVGNQSLSFFPQRERKLD